MRPASQAFSAAAVSRRPRFLLVRCQRCGPLERERGSREAAPPPRPLGRLLELLTYGRIGLHARRGAVPGAAVRLGFAVQDARQRAVGCLPPGEWRCLVDRGADEWVAKLELGAARVRQARLLGAIERLRSDSELRCGTQDRRELTAVVGRGDEQERLRVRRQPLDPRQERALDPGADGDGGEHRLGARQLRLAQGRGELEQRQRIAARLDDEPVAYLGRERDARVAIDQGPGRLLSEPAQAELREPGRLEAPKLTLPGGEQDHDALGLEPPGDEDECVRGRVVEPLRIVDEAQERSLFGGFGEQAQDCERDEEAVVASLCRQAERPLEGGGLRLRQALDVLEDGANDLVQGGERELRL